MKGFVGLLVIYVFFIMERLVIFFINFKRKQKKVKYFYSVQLCYVIFNIE